MAICKCLPAILSFGSSYCLQKCVWAIGLSKDEFACMVPAIINMATCKSSHLYKSNDLLEQYWLRHLNIFVFHKRPHYSQLTRVSIIVDNNFSQDKFCLEEHKSSWVMCLGRLFTIVRVKLHWTYPINIWTVGES